MSLTPTIPDTEIDGDSFTTTIPDDDISEFDSLVFAAMGEKCWYGHRVEKSPKNPRLRSRSPKESKPSMEKSHQKTIDIDHFDRVFAAEVKYILWQYHGKYPWLRTSHVTVEREHDFKEIVNDKEKLILDIASHDHDFKIGITCDPIQRWSLPGGPYCYDWEFMILLYAATTSKKEAPKGREGFQRNC